MEQEDHLKNLNEKLNQSFKVEDKAALWNELEPRLPQKRRKVPVLFFFLTAIAFSAAGLLWLTQASDDSDNAAKDLDVGQHQITVNDIDTEQIELKSESEFTRSPRELLQVQQAAPIDQEVVDRGAEIQPYTSRELSHNSVILTSNQAIDNAAKEYSEDSSSQDKSIDDDKSLILSININGNQINDADVNSNSHAPEAQSISVNNRNESERLDATKDQSSLDKNSDATTGSKGVSITPSSQGSVPTKVIETSQYEEKPIEFELLSKTSLTQLPYDESKLIAFPLAQRVEAEIENIKGWSYVVAPTASMLWNLNSQDNNTELGTQIDELTKNHWGHAQGLSLSAMHKSGIIFGVSIDRYQLLERFRLSNEVESTVTVTNDQAFQFEGQFISQDQPVKRSIKQDALLYNRLNIVEVSPHIGYQTLLSKWSVGITASPLVRLNQSYTGYLVDVGSLLTTEIDRFYDKGSIGISGVMTKLHIGTSLSTKFTIGIDAIYGQRWSVQSDENVDFRSSISSIGLGLRVGYLIN